MAILLRKIPSVLATLSIGALLATGFAARAADDHTQVKGLPGVSEDAVRESRVPAGEP
ncbi:MAG: hypothetical protein H0T56_03200 [Pseudaminobacter sp.]|nr:hypothetical protein [Pseudaminobacter sp.]